MFNLLKKEKNKRILIFFLLLNITFFLKILNTNAINIELQREYGDLNIEYVVAGPNSHNKDVLNIEAEVKNINTGNIIKEEDMKVHKYHVYSDKEGKTEILSGDLKFNDKKNDWEAENINLFWTGNGKFYVTVEFQTVNMSKSVETNISDDDKYTYIRASIWEYVIIAAIAVGVIIIVVLIIIGIRVKRRGVSIERKVKESKKELKIKTLTEEDLKKAKKKEKKKEVKKKEKGKTEISEDLIFSVPKWEVDDEDSDENKDKTIKEE